MNSKAFVLSLSFALIVLHLEAYSVPQPPYGSLPDEKADNQLAATLFQNSPWVGKFPPEMTQKELQQACSMLPSSKEAIPPPAPGPKEDKPKEASKIEGPADKPGVSDDFIEQKTQQVSNPYPRLEGA
ncbi:hypothetical protein O181_032589 [Austropuccinia psidii MF-1]|uniref:Uncharacterized protein n=1 Tax=Austropuccinia psidii MF-1 TaxID=1389203 RepID=A0A9Q3CXQ6_9BASI|nr:hypothetical protein [Austropuccinia psidii MF-1]